MNILVDADALIALAKKDDSNHAKAEVISNTIQTTAIYISPFTIPEAATVLSYKVSQSAATVFLKEMRKRKYIQLSITDEIERETDKIFTKEAKKGTSWIDCLNVALIHLHDLDGIFSFDRVYKKYKISYVEELVKNS